MCRGDYERFTSGEILNTDCAARPRILRSRDKVTHEKGTEEEKKKKRSDDDVVHMCTQREGKVSDKKEFFLFFSSSSLSSGERRTFS